ncbi:dephospho-CoA kinase [Schaalia meyeri]|nr:dephospho-CoA kinase [Schaalia meyeri]AKU64848.1 dephospho-CoA kinase [Schaalia meyeri]SDR64674.1 dephospho-CoA kinase [Schaalia meyeri]
MRSSLNSGGCAASLLRPIRPLRLNGPARIVAVSGGIGSGKSSVTRTFASLGAVVADADAIAREILQPGTRALREVAEHFGADLIRSDGTLDRSLLASRVFACDGRVRELNAITHPAITERAWTILNGAPEGALAVYDIPLLVEGDGIDLFDAVIMVDAPEEERIRRLAGRGMLPEDARARIRAQASSEERRAAANVWIDNRGSIADLENVSAQAYERWLSPYGGRPLSRPRQ